MVRKFLRNYNKVTTTTTTTTPDDQHEVNSGVKFMSTNHVPFLVGLFKLG